MKNYPNDVPGFGKLKERRDNFNSLINELPATDFGKTTSTAYEKGKIITGVDFEKTLDETGVVAEEFKKKADLQFIRRKNDEGYHYFISALKHQDTDTWITLHEPANTVVFFDPMTGKIGKAMTKEENGQTKVRIQLKSGESIILRTYNKPVCCEKLAIYC